MGVIIADSRTHAMRLGCSGVAIGCAGITAVIDDRGRSDLFGRKLEVTKRAVADNIASAAELVMGEADECTPAAIIRGLGMPIGDQIGIETIAAEECLFMGVFRKQCTRLFDFPTEHSDSISSALIAAFLASIGRDPPEPSNTLPSAMLDPDGKNEGGGAGRCGMPPGRREGALPVFWHHS
ncbi:MAG: coenzyme F420-0:L-glutamate ligase [Anaerotruncus sp.]|nr:coenzyme F420-0:L-glutamate ligase [Anaerotruncus sp.]